MIGTHLIFVYASPTKVLERCLTSTPYTVWNALFVHVIVRKACVDSKEKHHDNIFPLSYHLLSPLCRTAILFVTTPVSCCSRVRLGSVPLYASL